MGKIIEIKSLNVKYGKETILDNISLSVEAGEFVSVMGQSGCGKSTLLYSMTGMNRIESGSICLDSQEIAGLSEQEMSKVRLEKMGFVFQKANMLKNLSIRDNIAFPAIQLKRKSKEEIMAKASALMQRFGIAEVENHEITKVSGGQLQRAAICRALINEPRILFCDEPTGALNSSTTKEIMKAFQEVHDGGTTVFMVTHDAKVAARADRVIYLEDGKIKNEMHMERGMPEEAREAAAAKWLSGLGF